MFSCKALLSFALVCLGLVDAIPLGRSTGKATLGFITRFNNLSMLNIAEKDRVRAQTLKNAGHLDKRDGTLTAKNSGAQYLAKVGVGRPPTYYSLLVDTGSSITWIRASSDKPYVRTNTSYGTGNTVSVIYEGGSFLGREYIDRVTLSPELVASAQSIGVTTDDTAISFDGVLGLGPVGLTAGTVAGADMVPTVTDNLYSQGRISQKVVAMYFVPASKILSRGELHFGGAKQSLTTSSVGYVPITTTSPASMYWGIEQSISYGSRTILLSTAGIVDSGTTLILIATDAFERYQTATGAVKDSATGFLKITKRQFANLKSLYFHIGDTSYKLSPNAQIWPRSLNAVIGGTLDSIYLIVGDIGKPSGSGLDFINGFCFLERYYSVYDAGKQRVGFASTDHSFSETN